MAAPAAASAAVLMSIMPESDGAPQPRSRAQGAATRSCARPSCLWNMLMKSGDQLRLGVGAGREGAPQLRL